METNNNQLQADDGPSFFDFVKSAAALVPKIMEDMQPSPNQQEENAAPVPENKSDTQAQKTVSNIIEAGDKRVQEDIRAEEDFIAHKTNPTFSDIVENIMALVPKIVKEIQPLLNHKGGELDLNSLWRKKLIVSN